MKDTKNTVEIIDNAKVLMEEEFDWLQSTATELSEKTNWTIIAAITESDYQFPNMENGIQCQINTENAAISLTANGSAKDYLNKERIESILEEAEQPIAQQDYTQSLYLILLRTNEAYESGKVTRWHNSIWLLIAFAILCAAIGTKIFHHKNISSYKQ